MSPRSRVNPKLIIFIVIFAIAVIFNVLVIIPIIAKNFDTCFPGSVGYFFKSDLDLMTGRELTDKEFKFEGYKCTLCYYPGAKETEYDQLKYLLFENGITSYRALDHLRKGYFDPETVRRGDGWISGRVATYVDEYALDYMPDTVYEYYYRSGNLIAMASLSIPASLESDNDHDYREDMKEFDRLIEWIPQGVVWHPSYYYSENAGTK